ncbi:MAG: 16S rRNA (cytidine(1402)-2'-O)-methyltransferase [Desulfatiglandaceae bacterium]
MALKTPPSPSSDAQPGTLYVVATPIGNLEDITLRALRVLKGVEIIAAESVSHTKSLCEHYGIRKKLVRYHQHNQVARARYLVDQLSSGGEVALVTDAGTPGISDPGVYLIDQAMRQGIRVSPIPGPSAVITALSVSGMPTGNFLFLGFLSNRRGRRKKELTALRTETRTMVFFESPHRVVAMLTDVRDILGDRDMVMLREMTKVFEEIKRGTVTDVLTHMDSEKIRGEFTLVISGTGVSAPEAAVINERVLNRIESLLKAQTQSVRDIAETVSKEEGLAYRDIYKQCLSQKNTLESLSTTNGNG